MVRGILAAVFLALVAAPALAEIKTITGTATYLDRRAVPPGAVLEVSLQDISRADAPAIPLSSIRFALSGVPQPFQLTYDSALIDDRFTYTVSARILVGEKPIYRTTTNTPVLTSGAPETLNLVLDPVAASPSVDLRGTSWEAFELSGRMLVADVKPTLSFSNTGAISLFAGCNIFAGQAELSDGTITFPEAMAGTLRACPQPQEEMERAVLDAIQGVVGYVVVEDRLSLVNEAGVTLLRFTQMPG
ncbi:MAG: YbaY family lipoprotein [Pseudomonadota bacterium]